MSESEVCEMIREYVKRLTVTAIQKASINRITAKAPTVQVKYTLKRKQKDVDDVEKGTKARRADEVMDEMDVRR